MGNVNEILEQCACSDEGDKKNEWLDSETNIVNP